MKKQIKIIINEQHSLMEDQKRELDEFIEAREDAEIEFIKVPADGWNKEEMERVFQNIMKENEEYPHYLDVIFVSPVPYLIILFASYGGDVGVHVFHNDRREKKELPNGKAISVVAKEGWQII